MVSAWVPSVVQSRQCVIRMRDGRAVRRRAGIWFIRSLVSRKQASLEQGS